MARADGMKWACGGANTSEELRYATRSNVVWLQGHQPMCECNAYLATPGQGELGLRT